MELEEMKALIQVLTPALEQSTLTSIEVSRGGDRVRLEKNNPLSNLSTSAPVAMAMPAEQPAQTVSAPQPRGCAVSSPLVGVFYEAAAPEDAPFVTVGSAVKKGDVLCIVEAMKLMNEITAEQDGVITEICAKNGQVVEYGQPLFYLA